jgi:carboxymethylenebutenolidase
MPHIPPQGFLALPSTGNGPGVLVLHPWWGLNETIRTLCGRLASQGFITFAPDLYHGAVATTIKEAESLSRKLKNKQAQADIADAVTFLAERTGVTDQRLGVIGFSLGAYYALGLSVDNPKHVRAVVVFYGTKGGDYEASQAAYLGHFAQTDDWVKTSGVKKLEKSLRAANRPVTFYIYLGTGHWFFEQDRSEAYNDAAATLAWERTVTFLNSTL